MRAARERRRTEDRVRSPHLWGTPASRTRPKLTASARTIWEQRLFGRAPHRSAARGLLVGAESRSRANLSPALARPVVGAPSKA